MKPRQGVPGPTVAGAVHRPGGPRHTDIDHSGGWPTREQELLLRAALLGGSEAIEAWEAWRASVDIERIDQAAGRLLPLLYKNLRAHGIADPLMGRMRGTYRLTWTKNQVLFHSMAAILQAFREAGLATLILKGAALIVQYYHEYGLRPVGDFDVLVRTATAPAAIQLLTRLGLRPHKAGIDLRNEALFSFTHGHSFLDSAGHNLDLHWHVLPECTYPGADDDFWDGAVSVAVRDVPTLALNPADQLLHLCMHGTLWSPVSPIRWIADALMILNDPEAQIDWQRLLAQARGRHLVVPVREGLTYLQRLLDAPIPPKVLDALQDIPVSMAERLEQKARLGSWRFAGRLPLLAARHRRHSQLPAHGELPGGALGFLALLQHTWGINRAWKVPFYVVAKAVRRLGINVLDLGRLLRRKLLGR